MIFDVAGDVESVTTAAWAWLDDLADVHDLGKPEPVSYAVKAVAERARLEAAADGPAPPARARARARSGRWLLLYGVVLDAEGRVAVIVEPARPDEIAPIILRAYGLSQRERQITLLCMRGLSTKEIAAAKFISANTVQDHLKSIFDKVGVRSRRELTAHIFTEQYQPRFTPLALAEPWLGAEIPAFRAGSAGIDDALPPSDADGGPTPDSS